MPPSPVGVNAQTNGIERGVSPPGSFTNTFLMTAEQLDKSQMPKDLYAVLDACTVFLGVLKTGFDFSHGNQSSGNELHDWSLTGWGFTTLISGSIGLAFLAFLGTHYKDKEKAYDLCLQRPCQEPEKDKLFIQLGLDGALEYTVLDPTGKKIQGTITQEALKQVNNDALTQEEQYALSLLSHASPLDPEKLKSLRPLKSRILAITLARGHTKSQPLDKVIDFFVVRWPEIRDILKAVRWSQRSLKTSLDVSKILAGQGYLSQDIITGLSSALLPVTILLGGVGLVNRVWNRRMQENRKKWSKENNALFKRIDELEWESITLDNIQTYRDGIKRQLMSERKMAFASAAIGGLIDGMYMYLGVLTLTAVMAPWLYLTLVTVSLGYVMACIVSRVYEEKAFQDKFIRTQKEVELKLLSREIQLSLQAVHAYYDHNAPYVPLKEEPREDRAMSTEVLLHQNCKTLAEKFEITRTELFDLNRLTYASAFLLGLRNGLSFYAPITNILFTASIICLLASLTFPPWLLVAGVLLGVVVLTGFIVTTLYNHKTWLDEHPDRSLPSPDKIIKEFLEGEKNRQRGSSYDQAENDFYKQGQLLDAEAGEGLDLQLVGEWLRQSTRALTKSEPTFESMIPHLSDERGSDGKFHIEKSPLALVAAAACAVSFLGIFGARSLGRVVKPGIAGRQSNCGLKRTASQELMREQYTLASGGRSDDRAATATGGAVTEGDVPRDENWSAGILARRGFWGSDERLQSATPVIAAASSATTV